MRRLLIPVILVLLLSASIFRLPAAIAQKTPAEGEMFPDLKFSIPQKMEERQYLKVEGPFSISQVDSDVLILQVYSMYCPYCQKEASNVNALYQAISASPGMKSRIKIMGIGAGNSLYEVNAFRNLYRVEFPLIPDPDFVVHKALGDVRTPYFFVIRKTPKGGEVVYSRVGSIGDPAAFIDLICSKTGVTKGK